MFGLPKIEFEAVLAHELLHVWINHNKIDLSFEEEEGFCNLGRYLIYNNDQTHFSNIHLKAMEKNQDIDMIVCGGIRKQDKKETLIYVPPGSDYGSSVDNIFINGYPLSGMGVFFKRSILQKRKLSRTEYVWYLQEKNVIYR